MGKAAKKVGRYLSVGDPAWANRRRIAVGLIVFCCILFLKAAWFEPDHDFAIRVIDRATDVLMLALFLYGGGSTFIQGIKEWKDGRAARPRPAQGGD